MRTLKLLKYFITLLGLGLVCWGIYAVLENREFVDRADSAEGIVVQLESVPRSDLSEPRRYRPVVRFKARDGRSVQFTGSPTVYQIGDRVPVWYNPADPNDAKVGGWAGLWSGPTHAMVFGVLILLIWAVIYRFLSAKEPAEVEEVLAALESGADCSGRPVPLGKAVRENWMYLVGVALWGPYIFLLEPRYEIPSPVNALVFFVTLGLAFVPVIRGKAPMIFWGLALGIWMAGAAVALVWQG